MPASELSFRTGDLDVVIGDSGFPVRVRAESRPGQDYLAAQGGPGELIISGRRQRWEFAGMITDVDESEARYAVADHPQLEYTVRNSFAGHWLQRHMVVNTSSASARIDRLVIRVPPADGCVGWASAVGGDAYWSVQPSDGLGPMLIGELMQGSLVGTDPDDQPGFATGPITLPANRRFVVQWRIQTAAGFVRSRPTGLSHRTELAVNEPYEIGNPDTAVVADDPLLVSTEGDVEVINSDQPGRYLVELRSGRGTSRLDLAWVPSAEQVITELSRSWLGGPRSGAGVGVLPGPGAALGLQQAVIGRLTDDLDEAEDALALHTARLLAQGSLSIMDQAFLAQETVRTGDPEPLERARAELLATDRPRPGLGLAATRLCLAELALGGAPAEVIARLHDLAVQPVGDPPPDTAADQIRRTAAHLELITVTGPSVGRSSDQVITDALAVGAQLGSGLLGHRLGRLRPSVAVYAAAVLDLMPDSLGAELERHWGITAHALADRTRTSALAAVLFPPGSRHPAGDDELAETVGWLVLGRPAE